MKTNKIMGILLLLSATSLMVASPMLDSLVKKIEGCNEALELLDDLESKTATTIKKEAASVLPSVNSAYTKAQLRTISSDKIDTPAEIAAQKRIAETKATAYKNQLKMLDFRKKYTEHY